MKTLMATVSMLLLGACSNGGGNGSSVKDSGAAPVDYVCSAPSDPSVTLDTVNNGDGTAHLDFMSSPPHANNESTEPDVEIQATVRSVRSGDAVILSSTDSDGPAGGPSVVLSVGSTTSTFDADRNGIVSLTVTCQQM